MELLHGQKVKFSLPDQRGKSRASILEKYRGIEYHRSGCQSECRIRFMPPARGLSHIIRRLNVPTQRSLSQRELKVIQTIFTKATSLQRLLVLAEIPYIDCCLNISTTAWLSCLQDGRCVEVQLIMAGHGRAEIRNFSSSVEKYFTSERSERANYFFNTRCNVLFII